MEEKIIQTVSRMTTTKTLSPHSIYLFFFLKYVILLILSLSTLFPEFMNFLYFV